MAGTACGGTCVVEKRRCETPVSKRISPVVCKRIRSVVVEPVKRRSSFEPATPVETSAIAVFL